MRKIQRRDRMKIYCDLLFELYSVNRVEKIVLSHIQIKIDVPFDRLKTYITELSKLGLIEDEISLKLTAKGKQYLKEYNRVLEFMNRMGLTY
jgi:predicted transcriptional regulator